MVVSKSDINNNEMFSMGPLSAALPALPARSALPPRVAAYPVVPGLSSHGPGGAAPVIFSPALNPIEVQDAGAHIYKRLLSLIDTYDYPMVQFNGQRRTGPPNDWQGPLPGTGCEIFIGKIPRDLYEDELFPLLIKFGRLYEVRLMMDFSGTNRGFGFAQYATPEEARRAVEGLDGYAIRPGKYLGVMKSLDNRRLFIGGLPKDRSKAEIMTELSKLVTGIVDVILYSSVVDKTKNRGFAFVEFESHRVAAIARRRMIPGGVVLWDHELAVDWAEPEPEVPDQVMAKVKVLYMRNLMLSTPEAVIREIIETHAQVPKAAIEKVKKLKDFAFLHFTDRQFAEQALQRLNKMMIDGVEVTVVWAKPPRDKVPRSLSLSNSSCEDDPHVGRPIPAASSVSSFNQPFYQYWDNLVALCAQHGQEPLANVSSWPTKSGAVLFLARVTVPFLQPTCQEFHGNYAPTPMNAMDSAAEQALFWLHRNGAHNPFASPPLSPVGYLCSHP